MAMTEVTAKRMNMTEIIKKAKTIGIDPGKMKKADLISSIRTAEGSTNCFGTSDGQCAYAECCFMQDCFKISLAEHKQTAEHLKQQIGNFRLQTAECQRLEQCFIQLQTKLGNINSIIKDLLELREARPKVLESSTFAPAPLGCAYN